jgi:hypothetical protein
MALTSLFPDAIDAETMVPRTKQCPATPLLTQYCRSLNPAELSVLRAQYEREGDMVGVQTKFNYAWVRPVSPAPLPRSAVHPN